MNLLRTWGLDRTDLQRICLQPFPLGDFDLGCIPMGEAAQLWTTPLHDVNWQLCQHRKGTVMQLLMYWLVVLTRL